MDVKRARQILGEEAKNLTDMEILAIINMFDMLEHLLYYKFIQKDYLHIPEDVYNDYARKKTASRLPLIIQDKLDKP